MKYTITLQLEQYIVFFVRKRNVHLSPNVDSLVWIMNQPLCTHILIKLYKRLQPPPSIPCSAFGNEKSTSILHVRVCVCVCHLQHSFLQINSQNHFTKSPFLLSFAIFYLDEESKSHGQFLSIFFENLHIGGWSSNPPPLFSPLILPLLDISVWVSKLTFCHKDINTIANMGTELPCISLVNQISYR